MRLLKSAAYWALWLCGKALALLVLALCLAVGGAFGLFVYAAWSLSGWLGLLSFVGWAAAAVGAVFVAVSVAVWLSEVAVWLSEVYEELARERERGL